MTKQDDELMFDATEEFLDQFLDETNSLRVSTEETLDELAQLNRKFPRDASIGDKLSILRETLEQLSHSLTKRLDLINSFVRDGTDVIDGRLALTTRVLSERSDEITVSLAQLSNDLSALGEKLAAAPTPAPPQTPAQTLVPAPAPVLPKSDAAAETSKRVEELCGRMFQTVESLNMSVARAQGELEARLAKIESTLGKIRAEVNSGGVSFIKILAAVIFPLLLATGLAFLWSRYR